MRHGAIGTVGLKMRSAERRLDGASERRAQQGAAVVPTALMPRHRLDAELLQFVRQAQPHQDARGIRADLDAGANFAERARLLVDVHVEPRPQQ